MREASRSQIAFRVLGHVQLRDFSTSGRIELEGELPSCCMMKSQLLIIFALSSIVIVASCSSLSFRLSPYCKEACLPYGTV